MELSAASLEERTRHRIVEVEKRRQSNIESIVEKAVEQLPSAVTELPVEPDWSARFFADCQDIGDAEIQSLWARILAGETVRPGSFSVRTLSVLRNLSKKEALLFHALCQLCLHEDGEGIPFLWNTSPAWVRARGLSDSALRELQGAGLVHYPGRFSRRGKGEYRFAARTIKFCAAKEEPASIETGMVALTVAGNELSRLVKEEVPAEHLDAIEDYLRKGGWTIRRLQLATLSDDSCI